VARKGWGKLARRGAERLDDPEAAVGGGRAGAGRGGSPTASSAWRSAMEQSRPQGRSGEAPPQDRRDTRDADAAPRRRGLVSDPGERRDAPPPEHWEPEQWIDLDDIEGEAAEAVARGRTQPRRTTGPSGSGRGAAEPIEGSVRDELARALPASRVPRFEQRLKEASRAFEAERFTEAARILKKLADEAPTAAAVRELYGLTLYRLGRWRPAAKELEAFRQLTGSTEQHPVLADCYRALRDYDQVEQLWAELGEASPSAELVTEGRIVAAGALADQGDAAGAVRMLAQGFTVPKRPREHHLRRAYALADAYERAGDLGRARELFERVAAADPDFGDARRRARSLR
jgi:thioredoxin-like negative regulator of GroEL